jgi:hypothetical protein
MLDARSIFLKIAAICAIIAPVLMLGIDSFVLFTNERFAWTIGMYLAFVLFVPAVIGFTYMLVNEGSGLAIFGGLLAFWGAMAGASMQAMFRTHAVLEEQGMHAAVEQLRGTLKLVLSTQSIGLGWPLGLILLAVAYYTVRRTIVLPILLAAAAVLFPIGRIAGSEVAVIASGALFVPAFWMIGKQLYSLANNLE